MLKDKERVLELNPRDDGGYDVRTASGRASETFVVDENEPEAFIERMKYESGDIVVAPLVDSLRDWLKKGHESRKRD